ITKLRRRVERIEAGNRLGVRQRAQLFASYFTQRDRRGAPLFHPGLLFLGSFGEMHDEKATKPIYESHPPPQESCGVGWGCAGAAPWCQSRRHRCKFIKAESGSCLRPIGTYPPACMPYGQEAAPEG